MQKADGKAEKIAILKNYSDNDTLKIMLRLAHDSNVRWLLPDGAPPYSPSREFDVQGRLYSEMRRFYLFVEGGNPPPPNMPNHKRERLFIELLESLDPFDAALLCAVKDKSLPKAYSSVTVDVINGAFPGLVPGT